MSCNTYGYACTIANIHPQIWFKCINCTFLLSNYTINSSAAAATITLGLLDLMHSDVSLRQLYTHLLVNFLNKWCVSSTTKACFCVMKQWSKHWQGKCPLLRHDDDRCFQWFESLPYHLLWRCPFGLVYKCQLHFFSPEKRGEQHKWQVVWGICPPYGRCYSVWWPHQSSTCEVATAVAFVSLGCD